MPAVNADSSAVMPMARRPPFARTVAQSRPTGKTAVLLLAFRAERAHNSVDTEEAFRKMKPPPPEPPAAAVTLRPR